MMRSEAEIRAELERLHGLEPKPLGYINSRIAALEWVLSAPSAPASPTVASMSDAAIRAEIASREKWERETEGEELGGGSPMERHYERLEELDAELKRRESAPASPTGDDLLELALEAYNRAGSMATQRDRMLGAICVPASPTGEELDALYDLFQRELWTGCDAKAALRVALAQARAKALEEVAAWIEPQRADVPAHGWEFAAAIREWKDRL